MFIAYHEAGHAVVQCILGHSPDKITIIKKDDALGSAHHLDGDEFTEEGIIDLIINLYAGAEAEKLVNNDLEAIKLGASSDDDEANYYLEQIQKTEEEIRPLAIKLIQEHRDMISRLAQELMTHKTLLGEEIEILYEICRGEASEKDLNNYRSLRAMF